MRISTPSCCAPLCAASGGRCSWAGQYLAPAAGTATAKQQPRQMRSPTHCRSRNRDCGEGGPPVEARAPAWCACHDEVSTGGRCYSRCEWQTLAELCVDALGLQMHDGMTTPVCWLAAYVFLAVGAHCAWHSVSNVLPYSVLPWVISSTRLAIHQRSTQTAEVTDRHLAAGHRKLPKQTCRHPPSALS